jgi:hypothetical protein
MTADAANFETRLQDFVKATDAFILAYYQKGFESLVAAGLVPKIELQRGKKFIRVVSRETNGGGGVYCFLDLQGNIFKADGWKRPAKHIRGSIFDENFSLGKGLGPYGAAYLR